MCRPKPQVNTYMHTYIYTHAHEDTTYTRKSAIESLNYSTHTYSHTHILAYLLTHLPTYSLTNSPTHSLTYSLTHSLSYILTYLPSIHGPTQHLSWSTIQQLCIHRSKMRVLMESIQTTNRTNPIIHYCVSKYNKNSAWV